MSNPSQQPPLKVAAWCIPRSLSSVLTQSITSQGNAEVFFEYYATAAHGGPEKIFKTPGNMPNDVREPLHSFQYVKDQLEADYPSREIVFVKDMAYAVDGRYDKLPHGYIHTFLTRHPGRVFPSLVRLAASFPPMLGEVKYHEISPSPGQSYKEQWDLFQYVTNELKQPAIVIDADDLIANPASIMKQYCDKIGFKFTDDLLTWEPDLVTKHKWNIAQTQLMANQFIGHYRRAFGSTSFEGGDSLHEINYDNENDDVKASIEYCLPFYEKLLKNKINP
ncbi:uncharacterized protein [Amphiura filiformis]|uniref:uncharacterized protein n=1 Tax=Amphiura filiformis TaxID=82378 RepID=UPI003B21A7C5